MENTRNKSSESHSKRYQKDYTKLEAIFDAAVKRSRRKKIIYYASDRLYSENSRREIAQNSYKAVAWAEPLEEKDIHTEIIDLAKKAGLVQMAPSKKDEKELLAFIMSPDHAEAQEGPTSHEVLKALEELNDQNEESSSKESKSLSETVESPVFESEESQAEEETETLSTEPSSESEQDFLERYYKTKQEVLGKLEHSAPEPEEATEVLEIPEEEPQEQLSEPEVEVSSQEEEDEDEAVELRSLLETLAILEDESSGDIQEETLVEEESLPEKAELIQEESSPEEDAPEKSEPLAEDLEAKEVPEPESQEALIEVEPEETESLDEMPVPVEEPQEIEQKTQKSEPEQSLDQIVEVTIEPEIPETENQTQSNESDNSTAIPLESIDFLKEENKEIPHEAKDIDNTTHLNSPESVKESKTVKEAPDSTVKRVESAKDLVITEALTYENVHKDYNASTVSVICSLAVLAIFVLLAYQNFLGFDYIALILTLVGIFLAWDMRSKSLILMGVIMLLTLITCMMIWVNQTRVLIDPIHYFWFFIIPLCMGVSYAYFNSKKALDNFNKQSVNRTSQSIPSVPVPSTPENTPEKIDLKTIINDISEDESSLNYREELSQDFSSVSYTSNQIQDTSEKSVDINIDSTPNWSFYQVTENPDLLNYDASLEDYMPAEEQESEEKHSEYQEVETVPEEILSVDEKENTMNIPNLRDFIAVEKFGLSEEELNESLKTQDTGPVVFNNISQIRPNEYFELETDDSDN